MKASRVCIIPASGKAVRLGGLPKFLLPLPVAAPKGAPARGFTTLLDLHIAYGREFAELVIIATRPENVELIRPYLVPGHVELMALETETMAETVIRSTKACAFDETLVLMPDTYFTNGFAPAKMSLLPGEHLSVAAWKVSPGQIGSVGQIGLLSENGRHFIQSHQDKDPTSELPWVWGAMNLSKTARDLLEPENPHIGYVITRLLADNASATSLGARIFEGDYVDCGTAASYFRAVAGLLSESR
jgi:hypothetical protein